MSEEVKEKIKDQETVETPDVSSRSSDDIRGLLQKGEQDKDVQRQDKSEASANSDSENSNSENSDSETSSDRSEKEEEWFDKEKGFKTKEDALKSYSEAQNKLRELSVEKKRYEQELQTLKQKSEQRPLTDEEKQRQESVEKWKEENRDAIDFLKGEIRKDIEKENQEKTFEQDALTSRKTWKEEFDKDESRKALWPVMEDIYSKSDVFQDFGKNPFPYIEALAFKQDFPNIAEKIRAEAVEQYKVQVKEAEEAEREKSTARPGGAKRAAGEVDPKSMSSKEISDLLPRNDNG